VTYPEEKRLYYILGFAVAVSIISLGISVATFFQMLNLTTRLMHIVTKGG